MFLGYLSVFKWCFWPLFNVFMVISHMCKVSCLFVGHIIAVCHLTPFDESYLKLRRLSLLVLVLVLVLVNVLVLVLVIVLVRACICACACSCACACAFCCFCSCARACACASA